jgi:hypothetical protein
MARRAPRQAPAQEPEDEPEATARDYVMARLAAARAALQEGLTAVDEALSLFLTPDLDATGSKRDEMVETALEWSGVAARALECASEDYDHADPSETEPWE